MQTTQKAQGVRDVIRYLQKFREAVCVIYLDDKTIESPLFSSHIRDIALLHEAGIKVVIIPGARQRIDEVLSSAKISWTYHNNIRIAQEDAMPLIKMAAFDVSNIVMTSLAANNITATIGNWVHARAKGILDGFDYATAGEIDRLQTNAIRAVLDNGFIPIFPCIGWSSTGHPYNISTISLAMQVAVSLGADKLFFVMKEGSLNKKRYSISEGIPLSDSGEIPAMNLEELEIFVADNKKTLLENQKVGSVLDYAQKACRNGVSRVHIVDGEQDGVLLTEIFSDLGSGTMIYTSNYGKIRNMTQTDIPSVLSVMRQFIQNGKLLPRTQESLENQLSDFIVYELDGGIHACAAMHFYDDGQAEIAAIAVEEKFDHMGIGPKMMDVLLARAREKNARSIFILTTQASDWFEKLGFAPDSVDSLPPERKKIWSPERNSKVYRQKNNG